MNWKNWAVIGCLLVSACGYRFSGGGDLPGGADRISLGLIKNRSIETGLEGVVANGIASELSIHGKRFAYGDATAPLSLSGEILSVSVGFSTRKTTHVVMGRQVTVTLAMRLTDRTGKLLWEDRNMSDTETYDVVDDQTATDRNKEEALGKVVRRLAERVYYRLTDNF